MLLVTRVVTLYQLAQSVGSKQTNDLLVSEKLETCGSVAAPAVAYVRANGRVSNGGFVGVNSYREKPLHGFIRLFH